MECGQSGLDPAEFHPHLYCVLFKAGIRDQAAYLKASGWVYEPEHNDGSLGENLGDRHMGEPGGLSDGAE